MSMGYRLLSCPPSHQHNMVTVYSYTCRPQFHLMQYVTFCNKNPHRFFYKILIMCITILNHYNRCNQTSTHLQYYTFNQTQAN